MWRPKKSENDCRQLWVWVHPVSLVEAKSVIESAISNHKECKYYLYSFSFRVLKLIKLDVSLEIVDDICRFELIGPKAHSTLQMVLKTISESENDKLWSELEFLRSPSSLPPGTILSLSIQDPRMRF